MTQDTRGRLAVLGQGYVGLPLAMRAVEAGYDVVGFDVNEWRVDRLQRGSILRRGHHRRAAARRAWRSGRYPADAPTTPTLTGFDVAVITVPTPLREGAPDLSLHRGRGARRSPRSLRPGAAVILESTTYPGTTEELLGPLLEQGSGLRPAADFHLGYSPERIDPGNPTWTSGEHAEGRVRDRRRVPRARSQAFYGAPRRARSVPVSSAKRGRADQAAREHVPARQHRAGQRAGDVRARPRHRRLGGDRRRLHQAVRLHALHARARGRRPLPADRPVVPVVAGEAQPRGTTFRFVELANDVNDHMPDYVVHRLIMARLNQRRKAVNGQPAPRARARLQEEHRRRARVTRDRGGPPALALGRARSAPPTRTSTPDLSRPVRWSTFGPGAGRGRTRW